MSDDFSKATPRPWKQGGGHDVDGLRTDCIYDADGHHRVTVTGFGNNAPVVARLIVAAVNERDADRQRTAVHGTQEQLAAALHTVTVERDAIQAENESLKKLVYVPGLWRCAKCDFQLLQSNLNAIDGSITARDQPGDKCPNCDSPLWRVTERQAGNDMVDRCEEQVTRACAAEAERDALRQALAEARRALRFIEADPAWDDQDWERAKVVAAKANTRIDAILKGEVRG